MTKITNKKFQERLIELLSHGLVSGSGDGKTTYCVEQAIAVAAGEELSDHPLCALAAASAARRRLNDAPWSSPQARADGLREFALAAFGTAHKDPIKFARIYVIEGGCKVVIRFARECFVPTDELTSAIDTVEKIILDPKRKKGTGPAALRALGDVLYRSRRADRVPSPDTYLRMSADAGVAALKQI
jgi:hypothetical protein